MLCYSLFVQCLAKRIRPLSNVRHFFLSWHTEIESTKIVFFQSGIQSSVNMSMALSQEITIMHVQYSWLIRIQGLQKYPPPNKVLHSVLFGSTFGIKNRLKSVRVASNKLFVVVLWNFYPFLLTKHSKFLPV